MTTQNFINEKTQALKLAFEKNKLLKDNLDFEYFVNENDEPKQAIEALREAIDGSEIIYYVDAMEFLSENDPSLYSCLELASDLGFNTKDLNSEMLATILLQDMLATELNKLR